MQIYSFRLFLFHAGLKFNVFFVVLRKKLIGKILKIWARHWLKCDHIRSPASKTWISKHNTTGFVKMVISKRWRKCSILSNRLALHKSLNCYPHYKNKGPPACRMQRWFVALERQLLKLDFYRKYHTYNLMNICSQFWGVELISQISLPQFWQKKCLIFFLWTNCISFLDL